MYLEIGTHSVRRVLAAVTDRPLMGTARPFHISHDMTSEHQQYWKPAAENFLHLQLTKDQTRSAMAHCMGARVGPRRTYV